MVTSCIKYLQTMAEESHVADYFVVAGLPDDPQPMDDYTDGTHLKQHQRQIFQVFHYINSFFLKLISYCLNQNLCITVWLQ